MRLDGTTETAIEQGDSRLDLGIRPLQGLDQRADGSRALLACEFLSSAQPFGRPLGFPDWPGLNAVCDAMRFATAILIPGSATHPGGRWMRATGVQLIFVYTPDRGGLANTDVGSNARRRSRVRDRTCALGRRLLRSMDRRIRGRPCNRDSVANAQT